MTLPNFGETLYVQPEEFSEISTTTTKKIRKVFAMKKAWRYPEKLKPTKKNTYIKGILKDIS